MHLNATILGQAIAFFFFVLFCMKYVWPPLIKIIENRQQEILENFNAIEQEKKQLEKERSETLSYLEQVKLEAKNIIEKAHQHQIQIMEESKNKAKQEYKKLMLLAQEEILLEKKRAQEELRQETVKLTLMSVEKLLESSINKNINSEIINQFINRL